jgi:hypothetical protein
MASTARRASADADDGDVVMLKARLQVALHTLEQKGQALQKLERMVLDQQKLVETERGGASAMEVWCTNAMADVWRLEVELVEEWASVRRRQKGWWREREQRDAQLQQLLPQAATGLALCEQERQDAQLAAAQADARAVEAQRMAHQRDQMQANAVSQRAAWVPMLRSLINSVSNAYRWAGGAENPAHLFQGHLGCLQRMGHVAGAWRCIIAIRCRQMLCRREQRGCRCCGRSFTA